MSRKKITVFIDFDRTIIDGNSDLIIKTLAGSKGIPHHIEKMSKDPNGWTAYMSNIFKYLYENNVSKEDYMSCLSNVPLVDGMEVLFKRLSNPDCEIVVLSDANSFFIDFILQHYQLSEAVSKIFTNPARFDKDGCLQIEKFQENSNCSRCPDNLCKGFVVQNYISHIEEQTHVFYIGDGHNDLCPVLKLTAKDIVFPREGYRLSKLLKEIPAVEIKPVVRPWINAYDILNSI